MEIKKKKKKVLEEEEEEDNEELDLKKTVPLSLQLGSTFRYNSTKLGRN